MRGATLMCQSLRIARACPAATQGEASRGVIGDANESAGELPVLETTPRQQPLSLDPPINREMVA